MCLKLLAKFAVYEFKIYEKKIFLFISINRGCIMVPFCPINNMYFSFILFNYIRLNKVFLRIEGFGFKWKQSYDTKKFKPIYLKLGLTHRVLLLCSKDIKCVLTRKRFKLRHRFSFCFDLLFKFLFRFYLNFVYYRKGIYVRGTMFKKKLPKRKSKY